MAREPTRTSSIFYLKYRDSGVDRIWWPPSALVSGIVIMRDDVDQGTSPRAEFGSELDAEQPGPSGQDGTTDAAEGSAHVQALEQRLQAPDAVMEPDIFDVLGDYMQSSMHFYGTDADAVAVDVVRFLEGGYEGYAHMGSLVCSWLRIVDENNEDESDVDEHDDDENDDGRGAKRQRVDTPNSLSVKNSGIVNYNNTASADIDGAPADEAWFLRELILEKFKPSTFENLFTSGGGGPPRWLNALVSEPGGRELIFQLSNKHDDSLLLSFALKKIVSKGYDEEVARKDVDLSRYFDVYHSILMVRLRALASTNDEREISRLYGLVQRSALSSMLGYLHVRQVLTRIASKGERKGKPWASRFRRMYQDLEAASKEGLACKMSRCFVELMCRNVDGEVKDDISFVTASVVGDVLATAVGGHVAPTSDVIKLQRLYSGVELDDVGSKKSGSLPSVTLLHHPVIVEVLLRSMFNPSKKLRGDALDAHAFVLSVAVGGIDEMGGETGDVAASIVQQPTVARLMSLIRAAVLLSHKATDDTLLTEDEKVQADSSMSEVICATGVLVLLRKKLTSAEYWSSAYHVHKEPPFLALLFSIVDKQPSMHRDVFSLIKDAMRTACTSTAGTDVVAGLVRVLIELCKTGLVEDILAWAVGWARNANADISRSLVLGLLEIAAPPYSGLFVESIVKLMNAANLRRQSMGSRLWNANRDIIKEFYRNIETDHVDLALDKSEKSYLRDLSQCLV